MQLFDANIKRIIADLNLILNDKNYLGSNYIGN